MKPPLRLCYVYVPGAIVERDGDLSEDLPMNKIVRPYVTYFKTLFNVSFVKGSGIGSLIDSSYKLYDGCIGSIQQNESNFAFVAPHYPLDAPGVQHMNIDITSHTSIATVYHQRLANETTMTHVLDFVEGYSLDSWIATVMSLLLFYILIFMSLMKNRDINLVRPLVEARSHTEESITAASEMLIAATLKQASSSTTEGSKLTVLLYTGMTMLCFYCGFYLTSMIKTEMVAMRRPETYDSYQDILDHDVTPVWVTLIPDFERFKFAKEGSVKRQIWDRAVDRGLYESTINGTNIDMDNAYRLMYRVADRENVILIDDLIAKQVAPNVCSFSRKQKIRTNVYAWIVMDESEGEFSKGFVASTLPSSAQTTSLMRKTLIRLQEGGHVTKGLKESETAIFSNEGVVAESEECSSSVIIMPDHEMESVKTCHYNSLFKLCIWLIVLALVIFLLEQRMTQSLKVSSLVLDA